MTASPRTEQAACQLVQARLAIIDLSHVGHQPMRDKPPQEFRLTR